MRPDEVEILVARELRKGGMALGELRLLHRAAASRDDRTAYVMRFGGSCGAGAARREVIIEFRNQAEPVTPEIVRAMSAAVACGPERDAPVRLMPPPDSGSEPPPSPALGMVFSTSGYALEAVRLASTLGVRLLAVADGPAAFRRGPWSMGETTPAWVPEYMAEVVSLGPDGAERRELLVSGRPL